MHARLSSNLASASLLAAAAHARVTPQRTEGDVILARLPLVVEVIEKEYAEFNAKHAARKQKRIIPQLFYSFYTSTLCTNFILALYEYLDAFLRCPPKKPETIGDTASGSATAVVAAATASSLSPESARKFAFSGQPAGASVPSHSEVATKLQRVAETWGCILLYRSDMNRFETITVSKAIRKSEHFLNDTFDALFFEALNLLVEYTLEFRFMDAERAHEVKEPAGGTTAKANSAQQQAIPSALPSPTSAPSPAAAALAVPVKSAKATASAAAIAAAIEANWRTAQHELQRLLRSRNFSYSAKQRPRAMGASGQQASQVRGNGLHHIPLGIHGGASDGSGPPLHRRHPAHASTKSALSYRDPSTFNVYGGQGRKWNDPPPAVDEEEDARALSHLPGHFHTKGQQGILECLDLRSPLVSSLLPNPRTMAATNDQYVFGVEERRAKQRKYGRLTHAEESYLLKRHAKEAAMEASWKQRLDREQREAAAADVQEEVRRQEEADRMRDMSQAELQRKFEEEEAEREVKWRSDGGDQQEEEKESHQQPQQQQQEQQQLPRSTTPTLDHALVPPIRLAHPLPPGSGRSVGSARPPSTVPGGSAVNSFTPVPPPAGASRSGRMQATVSLDGSQTARPAHHLAPMPPAGGSSTTRDPPSTARRMTLDEKLTSDRPIIRLNEAGRIVLTDFRI